MFKNELCAILGENNDNDLNNKVAHFDSAIEETLRKFTITRTVNEKDNVNKWFNGELRRLKTEKVIKYQIAKMENT